MSTFKLGKKSIERLVGVHPDLVRVVERAIQITPIDFTVLEGVRTKKRQKQLYDAGASKILKSRHLTGHAVDLGALVGGKLSWDWPLYHLLYEAMYKAARLENVHIYWGGHWLSFPDGPHYELSWSSYPLPPGAK